MPVTSFWANNETFLKLERLSRESGKSRSQIIRELLESEDSALIRMETSDTQTDSSKEDEEETPIISMQELEKEVRKKPKRREYDPLHRIKIQKTISKCSFI